MGCSAAVRVTGGKCADAGGDDVDVGASIRPVAPQQRSKQVASLFRPFFSFSRFIRGQNGRRLHR